MFGSMHRIRRNRRNRTNVTITYRNPPSQSEIYYEMYLRERRKRKILEWKLERSRDYVEKSKLLPDRVKRILKTHLK